MISDFKKILCLFTWSLLPLVLSAQVQMTDLPYLCDFEDDTENALWTLNPGASSANLKNLWVVSDHEAYTGQRSMYISDDGGKTNHYTPKANIVIAYRSMMFEEGSYDFSFDWKGTGNGENGYLKVLLTTRSAAYISSQGNSSEPSYFSSALNCIDQDNPDTKLYGATRWQHFQGSFQIYPSMANRDVKLMFVWVNTNIDIDTTSIMVDNLQLAKSAPSYPNNLYVDCDEREANVYWSGSADSYEILYRSKDSDEWHSVACNEAHLQANNIPYGAYELWICSINGQDKSIYSVFPTVFIYPTQCFDVLNMYNASFETYTYRNNLPSNVVRNSGSYHYATEKIDDGYQSILSRQTTHFLQDEYDERTLGGLKTVPEGEFGSIRLGNWEKWAEWESISFKYEVSSARKSVLLLKYAIVVDDVSHPIKDQAYFSISIKDEQGQEVNTGCTDINFHTPTNEELRDPAVQKLWHKNSWNGSLVRWQDWFMIGLDLSDYQGQTLTVKLETHDCTQSGHFCYAYFTLRCSSAELEGIPWGENSYTTQFIAPEGFEYEWVNRNDTNTVISTEREFNVNQNDTMSYYVDCTYLNQSDHNNVQECTFRLEATARPHTPHAEIGFDWLPENCENKYQIYNKSHIDLKNQITGDIEHRYDWTLTDYYWRQNGDSLTTLPMYKHDKDTFPITTTTNNGDTLNYSLWTGIWANDTLWEDKTDTMFIVPKIGPIEKLTEQTVCYNGSVEFPTNSGKIRTSTGLYYDSLKSVITGCDSTNILSLVVLDSIGTTIEDTICYNGSYIFGGDTLTQTKSYIKVFSSALTGCDSVVTLKLFNAPQPRIMSSQEEFCPEEGWIRFDADNLLYADFVELIMQDTTYNFSGRNNTQQLTFSSENMISGNYKVTVVIHNPWCDIDTDTLNFTLNLPSSIVEAKWDNVLAILNEKYNGGYQFCSYQWYENGIPIQGATGSWYHTQETMNETSEYSVEVVLIDGTELKICPFLYGNKTNNEPERKVRKILKDGHVYIINDENIYNIFGIKVN